MTTVVNTSPEPRQHWCTIKLPKDLMSLADLQSPCEFVGENGERFPARGSVSWTGRHLVHVQTLLGGSQAVRGKVLFGLKEHTVGPFEFHPWVVDDVNKLVLELGYQSAPGAEIEWSTLDRVTSMENTPARQRVWARARIPSRGLILEVWLDVYSKDCVCPFMAKVVWSNRNDRAWNTIVPGLWIRCGEFLAFNFKRRHGIVGDAKDSTGKYRYLLGRDVPFCDGAALPLSGSMLCFRDKMDKLTQKEIEQSIQNIHAAAHDEAAVLGVYTDREETWMSLKHVPRVDATVAKMNDDARWSEFAAMLEQTAGFFVKRPLGCSRTPGDTGTQEDFAATKGTLVLYGYVRHLMRMRYSVQGDLFRGFQHYEANGEPIKLSDHTSWVTWSFITHYSGNVSQDRLGKESPVEPANGWRGYDDQHHSQNNLAAYLELFDDPLMLDATFHMLTTCQANYRRRFPDNGPDSARGQGRPVQSYTNLGLATGDTKWFALVDAQVKQSAAFMRWLGNGPMRVLSNIGPDGRVPVFVDGTLAPTVSLWEHALALVGFAAVRSVLSTDDLHYVCANVSKLLLDWAIVKDAGGGYRMATSIHWNNGADPLAVLWDNGSGVGGWINAGLRVACELLPDHPRATLVLDYLRGVVQEPDARIDWAEWWAATKVQVR